MYVLNFEGDEAGKRKYEICFQGIMATNKTITKGNQDDFVSLIRKIKKIGEETGMVLGNSGIILRELAEGGGTLHLERSEYKLLTEAVDETGWRPPIIEQKVEVEEWLKSIKQVDGSLAVDARPEEKRRALALAEGGKSAEPTSAPGGN